MTGMRAYLKLFRYSISSDIIYRHALLLKGRELPSGHVKQALLLSLTYDIVMAAYG